MAQDDFLPLILLFLFGGFAVLSALLRTRARVKALVSIGLMALERLAGFALMAAALPTSGSLEAASRMGIIAAVLVALSSTVHLLKVRERNRAREASEGKRLYASIRYGTDANPRTTGDQLIAIVAYLTAFLVRSRGPAVPSPARSGLSARTRSTWAAFAGSGGTLR